METIVTPIGEGIVCSLHRLVERMTTNEKIKLCLSN